MDKFQIDLS